jgi:small subunit ribosomal protein S2
VDFVIPGNDDAIRSIRLITTRIADACVEGVQRRRDTGESRRNDGDINVMTRRGSGPRN